MRNLPTWIPNVNAWINGVLLLLLARGIDAVIDIILQSSGFSIALPVKFKLILYFLALLSPIFIVALTHHWLHLWLDRFVPNTRSPEMDKTEGFFPGLMSWWEGLYSWCAIALALLVSNAVRLVLLPSFDSLDWWHEFRGIFTLANLVRLVTIACMYQFEQIVRNHLMSIGTGNSSR